MKQGNRLTRNQKEVVRKNGLNPNEWMYSHETEYKMYLIHKGSKTLKPINKK